MILKEYLDGENIFIHIETIEPFAFLTPANMGMLNSLLMLHHGRKEVYDGFDNIDPEFAAGLIIVQFKEYWNRFLEAENLLAIGDTKTLEETIGDNETNSSETSRTGKVSAYNSETFVNENQDLTTSEGARDNDRLRTLTETNRTAKSAYDLLTKEGRNSINSRIVKDVSEFFTLTIY